MKKRVKGLFIVCTGLSAFLLGVGVHTEAAAVGDAPDAAEEAGIGGMESDRAETGETGARLIYQDTDEGSKEKEEFSSGTLMPDKPGGSMTEAYQDFVFGSEYTRAEIGSVTFVSSLDGLSDTGWDVSEAQDGSVMAWVDYDGAAACYDLFIGAENGVAAPADCEGLFAGYENAKRIVFDGCFDTSNVTVMRCMFYRCRSLADLDVSDFQTENVIDMSYLFADCDALPELDVRDFDTRNATDMSYLFANCIGLTSLDVSGFDTGNVTTMCGMFYGCQNLTGLDISKFDLSNANTDNMFYNCPAGGAADGMDSDLTEDEAYHAVYEYLDERLDMDTVYAYQGYLSSYESTDEAYVFLLRSSTAAHVLYYVDRSTGDVYEAAETLEMWVFGEKKYIFNVFDDGYVD